MILDTSALVAMLFEEPYAGRYYELIHAADRCRMSIANYLELSMVLERQAGAGCQSSVRAIFS